MIECLFLFSSFFSFLTADYQALVMITLSCLLFSFLCLAHSRSYHYDLSNHESKGKQSEKELYFFILDIKPGGGWDLGALDFKTPMELKNSKKGKKIILTIAKLTKEQRSWKSYLVLVPPQKACMVNAFELNRIRF